MEPSRFNLLCNLILLLNLAFFIQGSPQRKLEDSEVWKKFENYKIGDK